MSIGVFMIGDELKWTNRGIGRVGKVIEIVKKNTNPMDLVAKLPKHALPSGGFAGEREEESYLLSVAPEGNGAPRLYWPPVSQLELQTSVAAPKTEEKEELGVGKVVKSEPKASAEDKAKAKDDASKLLDKVMDLKAMTDTENWQRIHRHIRNRIEKAGEEILEAEKPREVIQIQQEVKALRSLVDAVKEPVEEYARYTASTPLFAARVRASWSDQLGQVQITRLE